MNTKRFAQGVFAALIIPGAVYLIFALLRPDVFWRADVVYLLFIQSIESIILGWGMSFGMISGNMDLSVAAETILGTIVAAIAAKSFGIPGLVVGALATTMVVGWLKSLVLRVIRTNSLVISIAYCLLLGALGAVVAQNKSLVVTSAQTILGKAPWNILIAVGLGALMFYLHKYSVFGSNCRAVGGDAQLAKNAGIDKYKVYGKGFLVASFYAGFSAIISLSRGAGTAAATGLQSMTPIFSAMIGVFLGLMLTRWVNIVFGVISGILTMNIIGYGLLALSVEPDIKNTITGAFLLTIMTIMAVRERKAMEKVKRDLFNMQRAAKQVQYVKQEE